MVAGILDKVEAISRQMSQLRFIIISLNFTARLNLSFAVQQRSIYFHSTATTE